MVDTDLTNGIVLKHVVAVVVGRGEGDDHAITECIQSAGKSLAVRAVMHVCTV